MTYIVPMKRSYDRLANQLRPLEIVPNEAPYAEGSALIKLGDTHVLCTATVDDASVPRWMKGSGKGWVTAEYSMLPRSSKHRIEREAVKGKQGGRTVEIQRLIGRSLRAAVDMEALGERQIIIDCDVLRADGGTRCASISGGYVALALACKRLVSEGKLKKSPLSTTVAAISVGVLRSTPILDLDYSEDHRAEADVNVVMTGAGAFVEIQGTAEGAPFSRELLDGMLAIAESGISELFAAQRDAIRTGS
ncbi:MAG TPA: ribonuclease PH [Thermomicrobiales bacterium]|nr:ribonuclease PH [Thermomicrobiales bacterium]